MNSNLALKESTLKMQDFPNKKCGLTDSEVRKSRNKYGENRISQKKKKGFLLSFLESFGDPMIKILLIALIINVIFLVHQSSWFETLGIAIAILLATFVSTLSEYGSESAFEKLQEEAACIECKVQRAKGLKQIPIHEIVVGDIVLLQSGDRVPADGVITYGSLDVDQSSLNGESKEVSKYPQTFAIKSESEKDNFLCPSILYSGTIVCAGEGLMQVTAIGDHTYYGRIGAAIQEETRESPLRVRLRDLAASIGRLGYVAALFSVCAYFFNTIILDNNFDPAGIINTCTTWDIMFPHIIKACTLAVTVIVMAVPEGLPMMITVVLSANMKRMLKDNVLVRKLVGIETAGSLNILFTDKTGTLTQGKLNVTHFISGDCSVWTKQDALQNKSDLWRILCDAIQYNCAASMNQGVTIGGNATDRALLEFASHLNNYHKHIKKVNVIPFTSDLKYMATSITGDWKVTLIKGAPEKILPFCTKYYHTSGSVLPFSGKKALDKVSSDFAGRAVRLIAIAVSSETSISSIQSNSGFNNLILIGLLGIRDEIRPEAIHGIREVQNAGIQTIMITGDAAPTARAIASEVGLIQSSRDLVITSNELRAMPDSTLMHKLSSIRVVARALPSDKSRLVNIAQEMGLVVGMTGDGVNDAPALKQADIGFAMGSGTEVAKEAGDIVILDDNIQSISKAICYGRTIFKSIRKFIIYQLSICMCAVGVTIIGPLIRVDSPITVIQMLWINIVMDTLAGLAFSGEKARKSYMNEQPKSRDEKIINHYMMQQITVNSLYSTVLCLFFLKSTTIQNLFGFENNAYKMTAFFSLFMYSAIFTSFTARTHQLNLFDYLAANKPFLFIMGFVTVVQTMIIYYGGTVFRTVQLGFRDLILVAILSFSVIPVDLLRKYLLTRHSEIIGT